jgi:uncharacterized protein (DUF2147 family)
MYFHRFLTARSAIGGWAAAACLSVAMAGAASAADPIGNWLVANGHAQVKIVPCGDALWGVIDWTEKPGEVDKHNPDPAKRMRPVLGMPILLAMKPSAPNEWSGHVYNAENGKTYIARISLIEEDVLKITGCVMGGLFCGGENWTRVPPDQIPNNAQAVAPPPPGKGAKPARGGRRKELPRIEAPQQAEVCPS